MPITVKIARNIKNEPARYMSWLCKEAISNGPVVGSESTTAVTSAPEMMLGRRLPISDTKKFNAIRKGYLRRSFPGGSPLARPVTTYCFSSSSSRLARRRRIMAAVPEVPITMTGIQRCSSTDINLALLQGWPMNSASMRPPMDVPKYTLAK